MRRTRSIFMGSFLGWRLMCRFGRGVKKCFCAVRGQTGCTGLPWGLALNLRQAARKNAVPMNPPALPEQDEPHLVDELALLRAVIDAVPDPIFCKDREGRYLLTNQAH